MALRELDWMLTINGGKDAKKQIEDVDKSVDKLKSNMTDTDKTLSKGGISTMFKEAGSGMQDFGKSVMKWGAKATLATAPLMMGIKKGFSDALDLDYHIRQVQTLADASVLPVDKLRASVKDISSQAAISQSEVASAMYEALSSGVSTKDVTGFTEQGIKLAKAGFTDLTTVIDATTSVLNAYGDKAMDVNKIQDIFVKTQDLGKITVDELGKSIGMVIPTAAAAGVNVDQLGASYALLTSRGMQSNRATTALNSMLAELSSTGTKADKVLRQKTGKNFTQLTADGQTLADVLSIINDEATSNGMAIGDMFGNENASRAAKSMSEDFDKYREFLNQMQNADGSVDKNFQIITENSPGFKWDKAKTDIQNAMIEMGDAVSPVITDLASRLGDLAQKFSDLSPEAQNTAGKVTLFALAAGPVAGILGGIVKFGGIIIGGIGTLVGLLGGPLTLAFFAIAGVLIYVGTHFDTVKEKAKAFGDGIKTGFKDSMDQGKDALRRVGNAAQNMSDTFSSSEATIGNKVNSIIGYWNSLLELAKTPINFVVNMVSSGFNALRNSGAKNAPGGGSGGGSRGARRPSAFATGADYIPYDNYPAYLHRGEMVLTAKASNQYRDMGGTKDGLSLRPSLGGSRNSTFSPTINVNVNGKADSGTANQIAQAVRRELEAVFSELQLQQV